MSYPWSAGEILTADDLNAIGYEAAFDTFTPNFVNVNGGSGPTLAGRYWRVGPLGIVQVSLALGTGGSFAGPVTVTGIPLSFTLGHGSVLMNDTTTRIYVGTAAASGTTVSLYHSESTNNGIVGSTAPFTWTTADEINFTIVGFLA